MFKRVAHIIALTLGSWGSHTNLLFMHPAGAFWARVTLLKPSASGMPGTRRLSRWESYSGSCVHFTPNNTWKVYRGLVLTGSNWFVKCRAIHTLRSKSHLYLHNIPLLFNQGDWLPGWHKEDRWVKLRRLPNISINTHSISGILVCWVFHMWVKTTIGIWGDSKAMLNFSAEFSKWTILSVSSIIFRCSVKELKTTLNKSFHYSVMSPSFSLPLHLSFQWITLASQAGIWGHFITARTQEHYYIVGSSIYLVWLSGENSSCSTWCV